MHTLESDKMFERAVRVAPGGVHSPVRSFKSLRRSPIFFERAQGAYLHSVDGNQYIDCCQSFGPLILGHLDPDVTSEVHKMVDKAWTFGACEKYSLELGEWIQAEIPWVQKLRFVSSGTEATMSALRVARAYTKRNKILKFEGCYHGHVDSLLVRAGSGLAGESASDSAGISPAMAAETLVCPLNDLDALKHILQREGASIAAVIIEPLPANFGLLVQTTEYLKQVAALTKSYGCVLIFDEVISGFRVGLQGMAGLSGIEPDLVCYGKILGGGFPVGCYAGKASMMDLVAPLGPVYQAGTLSANPIGMRAGLVTLQKMKAKEGWDVLEKNTQKFCQSLTEIFERRQSAFQVTSFSSLFWIHLRTPSPIRSVQDIPKDQGPKFHDFYLNCLDKGLYLSPHAYEVGFLGLAHTDEILTRTLEIIDGSIEQN